MSNEVLVSLIALFGVLLSVTVSVFISLRTTNTEIQKLRTEIQQTYTGKLLDKRLELYPEMYYLLSDFRKKFDVADISKEDVKRLLKQTSEWNSKHSILFSGQTTLISVRFRKLLTRLVQDGFESNESLRELIRTLAELEVALKSDIGIYVIEFSDPAKRFSHYEDVEDAVQKKAIQK